jgi:hypothetical protein
LHQRAAPGARQRDERQQPGARHRDHHLPSQQINDTHHSLIAYGITGTPTQDALRYVALAKAG